MTFRGGAQWGPSTGAGQPAEGNHDPRVGGALGRDALAAQGPGTQGRGSFFWKVAGPWKRLDTPNKRL